MVMVMVYDYLSQLGELPVAVVQSTRDNTCRPRQRGVVWPRFGEPPSEYHRCTQSQLRRCARADV